MAVEETREDALFHNIVFRLDSPEEKLPGIRKKFHWFSGTLLGIVFFFSIISQFISANNIFWVDTSTHSLFESYCGIISFIIAYIIYHEYRSSGKRSNLYLFLGFISMGVFDFFHAYSNYCTTLFVWFHTLSAFSGGAYFIWGAVALKNKAKDPPWLRRLFVVSGIVLTVASAVVISRYPAPLPFAVTIEALHHIPVDSPVMGEFSTSTVILNVLSAAGFLISGFYFLRHFCATNDVLYHIFSLSAFCFFESEILFAFSRLWDPSWWYWHIIKLIIFVGLVISLAHGFTRTFNELRASRRKLTGTVYELRQAYHNLKDTQEELLEAEKLASIGKMAASIAHEIRNPLGAINNSVGIFKRHTQLSDEDDELMDIVNKEIGRLNRIITDFLNFAKPSPLDKTQTNLNNLIDETLTLFFIDNGNDNQNITINKYYDEQLPDVFMDRDAIKQCLWNIFINSVQAMPAGGALTIMTRYLKEVQDGEPYEGASVSIYDSGSGMSETTLSKAFQPFYSTKTKGTGLGLAIVQRIIEQHRGDISLSSREGKGTQVEITIPVNNRRTLTEEEIRNGVYIDS